MLYQYPCKPNNWLFPELKDSDDTPQVHVRLPIRKYIM
jgi:hypothetical protein